ncbi:MAG: hypothetical protein ACOY30_01220 [Bacillota bacterium]
MFWVKVLLSAAVAAGFAMAFNHIFKKAGQAGINFFAPVAEEWLKTGSALVFDVPVPGTHILFGAFEAAGDFIWGGRSRLLAALFGVMAHTAFGLITCFVMEAGYPVFTAVLASLAAHMSWNTLIARLTAVKRAKSRNP